MLHLRDRMDQVIDEITEQGILLRDSPDPNPIAIYHRIFTLRTELCKLRDQILECAERN